MSARQPAVAVKFVVVEMVLADQLGILRAASGHAVAHIEDDQSISPVREIGEPILHLQVVQITAAGHGSVLGFHADDRRILRFPARNFLGMFHILKIDDAQRARGIVGKVNVVTIDVGAVHAAADRRRVFGKNFQMRWHRRCRGRRCRSCGSKLPRA